MLALRKENFLNHQDHRAMKPSSVLNQWIISLTLALATIFSSAYAQPTTQDIPIDHPTVTQNATATTIALIPPQPQLSANGYVLMDAISGKVLAQKNMNQRMEPASLTKMMTLYLTFQALQSGQIHLNDPVRISKKAWRMTGSRMFLKVGTEATVEQLVRGVIIASGNDACVALAQYVAGTEATFAELMNQMAKKLDMKDTHYVDSTGMPNEQHYSTPYDMALLARATIRDFPEYYPYFNEKWITYNNIRQPNRNRLLWRDTTVDGLKTGHTDQAGFCLVASAKRNDMRLISVIMGAPSDGIRANSSEALLNYGFRFYKTYPLFSAHQTLTQSRVWFGKDKYVNLGLQKPLNVTIPIADYPQLKATMSLDTRITAPVDEGKNYGNITVMLNKQIIAVGPLVALQNDPKAGFFSRIVDRVAMLLKG